MQERFQSPLVRDEKESEDVTVSNQLSVILRKKRNVLHSPVRFVSYTHATQHIRCDSVRRFGNCIFFLSYEGNPLWGIELKFCSHNDYTEMFALLGLPKGQIA
jgi:hypothetical protein